jgi:phosphate transport system permease protein
MAIAEVQRPRRATNSKSHIWDRIGNIGALSMAALVVAILLLIYYTIGSRSFQLFTHDHVSLATFLTSKDWENTYGTLVLTVGSLLLVILGLAVALPLSLGAALFITEVAPPWLGRTLRSVVELFLGIPSVIFGLIGLLVIVPIVANVINYTIGIRYYTTGFGIVAAAIVVAFMVLPTITTITVDSLATIPRELREGSLALGATRWQTMTKTLIPAATPGILTGVILGAARILGETIAVSLVIGGSPRVFPIDMIHGKLLIGSTSVMTTQIFHDFADASGPDLNAIWSLSFFLIVISGLLVFVSRAVVSRRVYR